MVEGDGGAPTSRGRSSRRGRMTERLVERLG